MSKKEKPENTKAKEYLDNYTSKIHQKFLDQKKDKELFEIMEMSPAEKEKEYTKIKEDMKRFIEELKSDENYDKMKKIYHENMQKVHSFNKLLHDYNKELEIKDMKKHIQQGKEKIFDINTKKREIFVKSYKKIRDKLPESEKKNIIKELDKLMNDHEYFRKTTASFIEKIREINWKEVLVKDEFGSRGTMFVSAAIIAMTIGNIFGMGKVFNVLGGFCILYGLSNIWVPLKDEMDEVGERIKREKKKKEKL